MPPKIQPHVRIDHQITWGADTRCEITGVANVALVTHLTMEPFNIDTRIGSLPGGERRGTSGADAGRDSMQAVSGSLLNRRARVGEPEGITAEQRGGVGTDGALQSGASMLIDHSAGSSGETIQESNGDKRRKWSKEEERELMYCFYKAQSQGPGYINRLFTLFKDRNPSNPKIHKFNGNTLSNQARRIIKQKVISQELLNRIKDEAEGRAIENTILTRNITELNLIPEESNNHTQTNLHINTQHEIHTNIQLTQEQVEITDTLTRNIVVAEDQDPLILNFLQVVAETREIPVESRLSAQSKD